MAIPCSEWLVKVWAARVKVQICAPKWNITGNFIQPHLGLSACVFLRLAFYIFLIFAKCFISLSNIFVHDHLVPVICVGNCFKNMISCKIIYIYNFFYH